MLKRTYLLAACLVALVLGVAACGDDEEESTASGGTTTERQATTATTDQESIVAVAQATPDLSTLVKAVSAAGLVGTLEEPGPYTVFAPTNAAFEALGAKTLNTLLKPANKAELTEILTYHVVPGELTSSQLRDGQKLKTVQGGTLTVRIADGKVTIDGAAVTMPDVAASNGVVHVIDEVLTP